MNWRQKAACAGETSDLFFPVGASGLAFLQAQEAQQICQGCSVRVACLEWALDTAVEHGIWGGLTEDERRALQPRNAPTRAGTVSHLGRVEPSAQRTMAGAAIAGRSTVSAGR